MHVLGGLFSGVREGPGWIPWTTILGIAMEEGGNVGGGRNAGQIFIQCAPGEESVFLEQPDVVLVSDARHGNKDGCIFHEAAVTWVLSKVSNNPRDGATLRLVNSHRKSQIKGEWFMDLDLCNW